jgi:LacI family transcriptional regulator
VSSEKRQAVEQAIQRLNYRPSHIARSLKTSTTYSVGLLLNDITNPFYSAVAQGVEEEANRCGYSLILCNTNEDPQRELQYLEVLQDKQVDGIILGPSGRNADYICALAEHKPLVQVDRLINCPIIPSVLVDNEGGAYQAMRLLIERGHRRIAVFRWQKEITTMTQRYAGYERALREADVPVDSSLVIDVPPLKSGQATILARRLLEQKSRPTALFALNNQIGLGVLGAIQQLGLRAPQEVALIIFDDLDFFKVVKPSISAVSQPAFQIGEQAMHLITKQIEQADQYVPEIIVLPTEVILRESI